MTCARCADPRYAEAADRIRAGARVAAAAAAVGLHRTTIHRHARRCHAYVLRLSIALEQGRAARRAAEQPEPAALTGARSVLLAAAADGANTAEAARQAGLPPSRVRVWLTRHRRFRTDFDAARDGRTGAR